MAVVMNWAESAVLVTGATGSFGQAFIAHALAHLRPRRLIVFSRDELKQHEMRLRWPDSEAGPTSLRYFIGDVRDSDRLRRALTGVDIVIHAAALKQVPVCEFNPAEALKTNVLGTQNVVEAAIDEGVQRVMLISTDKACQPINTYGTSKAMAERLVIQGNAYVGKGQTRLSVTRYGNVQGSRGSVLDIWRQQAEAGEIGITHPEMTRFWMRLEWGVEFVARNIPRMAGGEIFIPKIPSIRMLTLARLLGPDCVIRRTGIRAGEKIHEVLISEDESRLALDCGTHYVIQPSHQWWEAQIEGAPVPEGFRYDSIANPWQLDEAQLRSMLTDVDSVPFAA